MTGACGNLINGNKYYISIRNQGFGNVGNCNPEKMDEYVYQERKRAMVFDKSNCAVIKNKYPPNFALTTSTKNGARPTCRNFTPV